MGNNSVDFETNEDSIRLLASFIAQLTKEGIAFKTENRGNVIRVLIIGY